MKKRQYLKTLLSKCTQEQQARFKQMYSRDKLKLPIEKVVDRMESKSIEWAITQCENTIVKFNL